MDPASAPAPPRPSRRLERLGIGTIGSLGTAALAVSVERAAGGTVSGTVLAGTVSVAAFLLGWLTGWLGEARRLAALLAENGRDVIARVQPDGTLAYISPASRAVLGYPPRALLNRPLASLCHPEDAPALARLLATGPPHQRRIDRLFRLGHADGHWLPTELILAPARHRQIVCVLRDVTRWQSALALARRTEADFRMVSEHAGDMIVRTRADRVRVYVSPASATVLGYAPEELLGLDFSGFIHPDDRERTEAAYAAFIQRGGRTTCRYRLGHKDGHWVPVESTWVTRPADDPAEGNEVVSVVRDISERVAAEERIAFLARHDPLTGLANRAMLQERTEQAIAAMPRTGPVAMLCLDLDQFKPVNDSLGHAAGDALLCEVANRITAWVRPTDTVARLGGDEFAVLQVGIERPEDAGRLAARLLSVLAAPFVFDGQTLPISASLGIAVAPADGTDYAVLLRNADAALYRAKADGRGRWHFFEPAMEARRTTRERMVLALRQALARGEFVVHYMPSVTLGSERITGFEALLRWRHPDAGLLEPDAFLPLAEETGLIAPIGAWVLAQACAEAAGWPEPISVTVNLSAVQLRETALAHAVATALAAAGLRAGRLELDITESVLLDESETMLAGLHTLRAIGVRIALDDFGTGYASLRSLRRFPFDTIKLDRSFVRDVPHNADALAIVRAVAGLGRHLGIATLAEGVETPGQHGVLQAAGYTQAQGAHYGRPGDRHQVKALLAGAERAAAAATP